MRGLQRAEESVRSSTAPGRPSSQPVMIVAGEPIGWDDLRAYLSEAAGGTALEEVALDVLLERAIESRGVRIGEREIAAERELLESAMSDGAQVSGARLVSQVRRARGLGPARWEGLLRRNAMLRALVQEQVSLTEADVAREYGLRYGARVRALLLTTATAAEASAAVERVRAGETFARVASEMSTDVSAARGGVIEPINLEDPTYPEAMRRALGGCVDGQMTGVIALENGFAVLQREGVVGGDGPGLDAARAEMERLARGRRERAQMGRLARQTLDEARIGVLDPALGWSWAGRTGADNLGGR